MPPGHIPDAHRSSSLRESRANRQRRLPGSSLTASGRCVTASSAPHRPARERTRARLTVSGVSRLRAEPRRTLAQPRRRSGRLSRGGARRGTYLARRGTSALVRNGLVRWGRELGLQPLDARAGHLDHLEADAVPFDRVPLLRRPPDLAEHEAGDGVVVLGGQVGPELLVEVVDREGAPDEDRPLVEALDRLIRQVVLVLDLADDLLEHVLERHDALHRPVLVDDDGHVLLRPAEVRQESAEILGLRNDVRLPYELRQIDLG